MHPSQSRREKIGTIFFFLSKPLTYFHRTNITSFINYINITNITNRELKLEITQLVIKLPIGDFEFGFGVCRIGIGDLGLRIEEEEIWAKHQSPFQNHQLVISTFSSLIIQIYQCYQFTKSNNITNITNITSRHGICHGRSEFYV